MLCDVSKNYFRKYLHVFKTMYELNFNVYEFRELKKVKISYLYLRRYVIKMFNLICLSDTLGLAYNVDIQT